MNDLDVVVRYESDGTNLVLEVVLVIVTVLVLVFVTVFLKWLGADVLWMKELDLEDTREDDT